MFSPYVYVSNGWSFNLGYAFLFDPPTWSSSRGIVNVPFLIAEWLALAVFGVLASLFVRDKRQETTSNQSRLILRGSDSRDALRVVLRALGRAG